MQLKSFLAIAIWTACMSWMVEGQDIDMEKGRQDDTGLDKCHLRGQPAPPENACTFKPRLYKKGVIHLPFNAAYLNVADDTLLITSFFNKATTGDFEEEATVAVINHISKFNFSKSNAQIEILSQKKRRRKNSGDAPHFVWPNEPQLAPKNMFHRVGGPVVVVPEGWFQEDELGGITAVDVKHRRSR
jgi:hypothetical protein